MKSSPLEKSKKKKKSLQEHAKMLVSSNVIVKLFISLEN